MIDAFRSFEDLIVSIQRTGSSFTCEPAVMDTDMDYLVYVNSLDECGARLQKYGWANCFEEWKDKSDTDPAEQCDPYSVEDKFGARFQAWRKGAYNLIVTDDTALYLRSVGATLVCKQMNLMGKADRIALFRAIKYGEPYTGRLP